MYSSKEIISSTVAVVGLGYVGLPLALAFGEKINTLGFDINETKLASYKNGVDPTGEMSDSAFQKATKVTFTSNPLDLSAADYIIVAVPTPIDNAKQPDLTPVVNASKTIAPHLKQGVLVVYESTVYPGVTEDICGPIIEKESGLRRGKGFKLGYSPERIVPGDKLHTLQTIVKLVAAEDAESLNRVAALYELVVEAGVFRTQSIRVAEAAKVIENTQRDVNIALMNELAVIFQLMGIDTQEVLAAAGTKWNFLPFRPGLVGGHCIGVDPYYLTHKTQTLGYNPEIILAARRINDRMGSYIAQQTMRQMLAMDLLRPNSTVLVLGLTFKENCNDIRNTKVVDITTELSDAGVQVRVWDPVADAKEARHEYGIELINHWNDLPGFDAIIAAVAHREIAAIDLRALREAAGKPVPFIDVKSVFSKEALVDAGFRAWRL